MKKTISICVMMATCELFAVPASERYVDEATNATLIAAKAYTDEHGGGGGSGGGVNTNTVKAIINDEVGGTNTLVHSLQISDMETRTHASDTYQQKGSYLTSESDPTVPSWAKSSNKPTYTASEVGAATELWVTSNCVLFSEDMLGYKTAIDIGMRTSTNKPGYASICRGVQSIASGTSSYASGISVTASGISSMAIGNQATASGENSIAQGYCVESSGNSSFAYGLFCKAKDAYSFAWGGCEVFIPYESKGEGSFCINPEGGISGFWIGETNLATHISNATSGLVDAETATNAATSVVSNYLDYALGEFSTTLSSGEIRSITPTSSTAIPVTLNFGSDATKSADALLYVDASSLTDNVDLDLSGYTFIGDDGYQTATKGKKVLFMFTRINATTVIANKREY